jgi:hypothetical protein
VFDKLKECPNHFYFQILAAREDIPSIIEGGPEALYRQVSDNSFEDWTDLARFETEDEMCNHVNQLFNEQRKLLIALRYHNQRASTSETCLRGPNCPETENVLTCIVCCARDHGKLYFLFDFIRKF